MRILDSFLRLRSYPPVPWHVWGFLHFLHYLHCFLIALDGCFSVKTPFVKVRFARFARIAVFFDGAYRDDWLQFEVFNVRFLQVDANEDIIALMFYFTKSDLFWAPNYCKDPLQSPVFSNGDLRSRWMLDPTVKLCNQEAGKLMRKQWRRIRPNSAMERLDRKIRLIIRIEGGLPDASLRWC